MCAPLPALVLTVALTLVLLLPFGPDARAGDDAHRETAGRILGRALVDEGAFRKLEYLTTRIGNRLSGSPGLEKAVAWAHEGMKNEGLEGARLQPVKVPRWVRGREWARVVSPAGRELPMLGLGMSVGTPKEGITAPVVVVRSFEELLALGREKVEGKIVAFAPTGRLRPHGAVPQLRGLGRGEARCRGSPRAVGHRSVDRLPHTGALDYAEDAPRIPAASIAVEDAEWLRRMAAAGETVTVSLFMEARLEAETDSANVIAEIRGARSRTRSS